jgi:MFS transporter, putative metabolite:H+ symporter
MAGNILAAFPLGLAVAAGLALWILPRYGWRALFVVGVVPALLLFFVRRYMPESVRYHINKGQTAEAEATVAHIEKQALGRPRTADEVKALPPMSADVTVTGRVPVMELLADGRARRTTLLWIVSFGFFWASNGLLFMLPTILQARGIPLNQAITFLLIQAIFGFFGYSACSFLVDLYGRRRVLFLYFFIGALFHYWFAEATGIWVYIAIACVGWVNPGVYGSTSVYVGELYPTRMRATAVGWFFGIGRIGSFLSPAAIGFMLHYGAGAWVLHTFALAFLIAAIALWLVGIETKGRTLEEIAAAK